MTTRRTVIALIILSALALTACAAPYVTRLPGGARISSTGAPNSGSADQSGIQDKLNAVNHKLADVELAARRGDYAGAKALQTEAYAIYESGPGTFLDSRNPALAQQIDGSFGPGAGSLQALIEARAAPDKISAGVNRLTLQLDQAATYTATDITATLAAFNSAAIILREGLEAVLIIAVILGYLRAAKRDPKYARLVFLGVASAVLLSLLTWWASVSLLSIIAISRQIIEGVTSLVAVAVLFYCTNWLFHKAYVVDWMMYVKQEAGKALATGSVLGLVALGFTVVYREGFETVLFYQTMLFNTDPTPVLTGLLAGLALLALIAFGVLSMSVKLPIRPFFTVTGALMLVLAFKFAGLGIREFQEAGLIGVTLIPWPLDNAILRDVLGVYPIIETLAAQAVMLLAVAVTFVISHWVWKRGAPAQAESA
jgi:high-affinity iron transporter